MLRNNATAGGRHLSGRPCLCRVQPDARAASSLRRCPLSRLCRPAASAPRAGELLQRKPDVASLSSIWRACGEPDCPRKRTAPDPVPYAILFMPGGAPAPPIGFPVGSLPMPKPFIALRATAAAVAAWLLTSPWPAAAQAVPAPPALTGKITSDREGPMEGVLVSAKKPGATITVRSEERRVGK